MIVAAPSERSGGAFFVPKGCQPARNALICRERNEAGCLPIALILLVDRAPVRDATSTLTNLLPCEGCRRVAQVFRHFRAVAGGRWGATTPGNHSLWRRLLRRWRLGRSTSQAESRRKPRLAEIDRWRSWRSPWGRKGNNRRIVDRQANSLACAAWCPTAMGIASRGRRRRHLDDVRGDDTRRLAQTDLRNTRPSNHHVACRPTMSWTCAGSNATSQAQLPNPPSPFTAVTHSSSAARFALF